MKSKRSIADCECRGKFAIRCVVSASRGTIRIAIQNRKRFSRIVERIHARAPYAEGNGEGNLRDRPSCVSTVLLVEISTGALNPTDPLGGPPGGG